MPRKLRVFLEDTPQLVFIKGNDTTTIFNDPDDYSKFLDILKTEQQKVGIALHAYALLPHIVYFLITPVDDKSIAKLMQGIGRRYVRYFNNRYERTGTLWEGRYKSSVIDVANYLFSCMKFIEQSPVRLGLCEQSALYSWSSARENIGHAHNHMVTFHRLFKSIDHDIKQVQKIYKEALSCSLGVDVVDEIEIYLKKQALIGSSAFREKVEYLTGQVLSAVEPGRPGIQLLKILPRNKKENLMFKDVQVLDKKRHQSLRYIEKKDLSFAKSMTAVPVTFVEALKMAESYPLVFSNHKIPQFNALISLDRAMNLAINDEGKWLGNHVPLFLQHYPFGTLKVSEESDERILVIDEESGMFSEEKGEPLFEENEEPTPMLQKYILSLKNYDTQLKSTEKAAKEFMEAGILDDREISLGEGDEKKVLVKGFKVVNKEKMHELDDTILADWVRRGYITLIDIHLRSLQNINTLLDRSGL